MRTVHDIYEELCHLAPPELQMDFDNAGFLVGHADAAVERVLLALDITGEVIDEAREYGAQLIVAHHPLIFRPLRSVTAEGEGATVLRLIEGGLAAICMHTNLDIAEGGVNDVLLGTLGEPLPLESFLAVCRDRLHCDTIRFFDAGRPVIRLAVTGGSGGDMLRAVQAKGCDTYVSSDIKYHQFREAAEMGLNLIDADHFCTEYPVMPVLLEKLRLAFPEVAFRLSERQGPAVSPF